MENFISDQNRNVGGSGKGSSLADDLKYKLPTGSELDRNNQKHNKGTDAPPELPWEMNNIISRVGDVFAEILAIKIIFNNAKQNPAVTPKQSKLIDAMSAELDKVNMSIADISTKLDDLSLRD